MTAVEEMLATTLVTGSVMPTPRGPLVSVIQIGDSAAWVLQENRYQCITGQKHNPAAQIISSAVSPLPRIPEHIGPSSFG